MAATVPALGHTYATLLLSDSYLIGALVLAHSLRDAGTTKQLTAFFTLDSISANAISKLQSWDIPFIDHDPRLLLLIFAFPQTKTVYDHVIPVPRIRNHHLANLHLANRPDLHSTFTKINLWKQTSFSKIVYLDADVVAYRAPDELFDLSHSFSAAPDIGWPDLFNSGVMVLQPDLGDFYALLAMAQRGISFDGADQGLLNMYFRPERVNRLSFTYNVTPSAHYQYLPAYRHFQSSISMVHFIGTNKPWLPPNHEPHCNSPYEEMLGRWWAVHDRHYRFEQNGAQFDPSAQLSRPLVPPSTMTETQSRPAVFRQGHAESAHGVSSDADVSQGPSCQSSGAVHTSQSVDTSANPCRAETSFPPSGPTYEQQVEDQAAPQPDPIVPDSWDAQRQPPPADSKPEALNFPTTHYEMSKDRSAFIPPARYPSPPANMWYEVPESPPAPSKNRPPPIFPWEKHQTKASRIFPGSGGPDSMIAYSTGSEAASRDSAAGSATEPSATDSDDTQHTPTTPDVGVASKNPWSSFPRFNAWDGVPEISRYVKILQTNEHAQNSEDEPDDLDGLGLAGKKTSRQATLKLTDFPSNIERPSLPVTPAPIRGPCFWGNSSPRGTVDDNNDSARDQGFLSATLATTQAQWNPSERLAKLAEQQSEALLRKLGHSDDREADERTVDRGSAGLPPEGPDAVKVPASATRSAPSMPLSEPVSEDASSASPSPSPSPAGGTDKTAPVSVAACRQAAASADDSAATPTESHWLSRSPT